MAASRGGLVPLSTVQHAIHDENAVGTLTLVFRHLREMENDGRRRSTLVTTGTMAPRAREAACRHCGESFEATGISPT